MSGSWCSSSERLPDVCVGISVVGTEDRDCRLALPEVPKTWDHGADEADSEAERPRDRDVARFAGGGSYRSWPSMSV